MIVLRDLVNGNKYVLSDGRIIGMVEDMSIGFVFMNENGDEAIDKNSTIDLSELNRVLDALELEYLQKDKGKGRSSPFRMVLNDKKILYQYK